MSTVPSLPVEEQIPIAEAIVREELDRAGLAYDISVEPWFDPEYPREGDQLLRAALHTRLGAREKMDLGYRIGCRLEAAGIDIFDGPLGLYLA